jgi:23S rRNA pseudoU1915 N3-methylase RlmH
MKLWIVAVGQHVPDWAQTAYDDYAKRFPPELKVELRRLEPRLPRIRLLSLPCSVSLPNSNK